MTKMTNKTALEIAAYEIEKIVSSDADMPKAYGVDATTLEVVERLQSMISQLEKRASAPKTPSKTQQENVTHKLHLLSALSAADAPMGIADLREAVEGDLTPNKVSALMGQLVTEGKAARIPGKGKDRKVTFTLA